MTPARQQLYQLWHTPGKVIAEGWWDVMKLDDWRNTYTDNSLTRPALDALLCRRLDHIGMPPSLSPLAEELLGNESRRKTLTLALGLWEIGGADSLLLKPYRDALSLHLTPLHLSQLQVLLPFRGKSPSIAPDVFPLKATELGYAWLSKSQDKALRACRLLSSPSTMIAPNSSYMPILQKLARWI